MKNKILYTILVIVIVVGSVYSYKKLDFGGKTTIFFKIAFGDQKTMMRTPPKKQPAPERGEIKPAEGGQERPAMRGGRGGRGGDEPPKEKRGKPGRDKVIYLGNVIPYTFILAFFILVTRVFDLAIRKIRKNSEQ